MQFSGTSFDDGLVEIIELTDHPWYLAVQCHPEFKSKPIAPQPLFAGFIGAAVAHKSGRAAANRSLCRCIQGVADATLTRGDQRRAARFFRDPHQAQEVRMSKSAADNAFWARYRAFGDMAETYCAG